MTRQPLAVAALVAVATAPAALAQTYPVKPVRIMTVTAGSSYDVVTRGLSQGLSQSIGQPVIVENRSGGNFIPASEACARAPADGYSLCTAEAFAMSLNPALFTKLPYDPERDFAPIIHLGHLTNAVIVHPSVPANTISELIALAKAKPNSITFGTAGLSSSSHLYIESLRSQGVQFMNVPYKSHPQAMQATMAGEVNATIFAIGGSLTLAKAGKLRLIAASGDRRSVFAPDVPSLPEAGSNWNALLGPAGIPEAVVQRMNAEFKRLLADPMIREKFIHAQGFELFEPAGGTPAELAAFMRQDREKFARMVKTAGVKAE